MLRLQILPYATEAHVSLTELSSFIGRQWETQRKKVFIINNPLDWICSWVLQWSLAIIHVCASPSSSVWMIFIDVICTQKVRQAHRYHFKNEWNLSCAWSDGPFSPIYNCLFICWCYTLDRNTNCMFEETHSGKRLWHGIGPTCDILLRNSPHGNRYTAC